MTDVLVVGAGPVGLTMAAELARHGVRCRIVDRLERPLPYCRAIGVTPRTIELWDDMGIARPMIDAGLWITGLRSIVHGHPAVDLHQDLSDLPYAQLGLPQYETERLLTQHLGSFGIEVELGTALTALEQDDKRVAVRLTTAGKEEQARFRYVVGCDGAHSTVRHAIGIGFEGEAFPMAFMLGDVRIDWDLPRGMALRALRLVEDSAPDMFIAIPLPERQRYRVSARAPSDLSSAAGGTDHGIQAETHGPDLATLQAVADDLLPARTPLSDLRWSSIFRISMRLAAQYRRGRVFIAGDAAHIHPPTGGQGMNTGIQDAYNLAWKLALVSRERAPESLLDSYEEERRPVGAEVVASTRAASESYGRERKPDRLADTQIGISYRDKNAATVEPAPGDRAPDAGGLRRQGVGFPQRLFDILRGTEHVLISHLPQSSPQAIADLAAFAREGMRVVGILAQGEPLDHEGVAFYRDEHGAFAKIYGPHQSVFLVRPDGHIAWRGESWRDPGLDAHLARTFR